MLFDQGSESLSPVPWESVQFRGHGMETFSVLLALCAGIFTGHRWIPRTKASDAELWCFSLICAWTNGWANNPGAGDLRRHHAHIDVTVMWSPLHRLFHGQLLFSDSESGLVFTIGRACPWAGLSCYELGLSADPRDRMCRPFFRSNTLIHWAPPPKS